MNLCHRQENWDSTLRLYYDAFNATLRAMSVEGGIDVKTSWISLQVIFDLFSAS